MPKALTIAASDSGGACGVQADIKTFSALDVYAASVITAVTAQNSTAMAQVHEIPIDIVKAQLEMVMQDIRPEAVKVGMIGQADNYRVIAEVLREERPRHLVVDPVVTCYRGCSFVLGEDAIRALKEHLLPLTDVFVPSIPDAEVILGVGITTTHQMEEAARALKALGPRYVVLKGGHLRGDPVDVIWDGNKMIHLAGTRIVGAHDNGSGCAFSSAVTAYVARGFETLDAVKEAKIYMEGALREAFPVGAGKGPVHFFHRLWNGQRPRTIPHTSDMQRSSAS